MENIEDYLRELSVSFSKSKKDEALKKRFKILFISYSNELRKLNIILKRLEEEREKYLQYINQLYHLIQQEDRNEKLEKEINIKSFKIKDKFELDSSDFFVHSKQLLDRTVRLIPFFFNSRFPKCKSFHSNKESILSGVFNHDKYVTYLNENTRLLDFLIYYRDNIEVHNYRGFDYSIIYTPELDLRIINDATISNDEKDKLEDFCKKFSEKYKEAPKQFIELMNFLIKNIKSLTKEEIEEIKDINKIKSLMPNILDITQELDDFLRFFNNYWKNYVN